MAIHMPLSPQGQFHSLQATDVAEKLDLRTHENEP